MLLSTTMFNFRFLLFARKSLPNHLYLSKKKKKYTQYGTIFQKKSCSTIKFFFSSNMFFNSKYLKKKSGVTVLCFLTNCRERWSWIRRSQMRWRIGAVGTKTRHKMALIVFEACTRDQACFRLFLCV